MKYVSMVYFDYGRISLRSIPGPRGNRSPHRSPHRGRWVRFPQGRCYNDLRSSSLPPEYIWHFHQRVFPLVHKTIGPYFSFAMLEAVSETAFTKSLVFIGVFRFFQ